MIWFYPLGLLTRRCALQFVHDSLIVYTDQGLSQRRVVWRRTEWAKRGLRVLGSMAREEPPWAAAPKRPFCFTSTWEAKMLHRDRGGGGGGGWRKSEGSTADTARKRPERPWTATRTMEVLRRCPLAIALRLVHCAIAVSNAVPLSSHKDNVRCTALLRNNPKQKKSNFRSPTPPPCSWPLLGWGSSSTSMLLISPGTLFCSNSTKLGFSASFYLMQRLNSMSDAIFVCLPLKMLKNEEVFIKR